MIEVAVAGLLPQQVNDLQSKLGNEARLTALPKEKVRSTGAPFVLVFTRFIDHRHLDHLKATSTGRLLLHHGGISSALPVLRNALNQPPQENPPKVERTKGKGFQGRR